MSEKNYIVYVDMLGYEKLAEKLFSATGYKSVDQAREAFLLSPFRSKCKEISEIYKAKLQLGNDDCYFLTSELETLFKVVSQISSIDIPRLSSIADHCADKLTSD